MSRPLATLKVTDREMLMRLTVIVSTLATLALVLGISGCGSSSSSTKATSAGPATSKASRPARIYHLSLTGKSETPAGAPSGTGAAVIAIHGSSTVCWRFAHLHGFTHATFAHLHTGARGKSGNIVVALSTGPALSHKGCVPVKPALIKKIEHNPGGYYVNIHSTKYPSGAVRAQL